LTIAAGGTDIIAEPGSDEWSHGMYALEGIPAGSVDAGQKVTVSAIGDEFPAFSVALDGLDPVDFSLDDEYGTLRLIDGQDKEITWNSDADGLVQFIINHGWHGAPPEAVLYCETPAATGKLVISSELIELLPVIGGVGLFQHGSVLGVTRRVTADVEGRKLEVSISRRSPVNPLHNADW
jgi:hypothetical protein